MSTTRVQKGLYFYFLLIFCRKKRPRGNSSQGLIGFTSVILQLFLLFPLPLRLPPLHEPELLPEKS